MRPDCARKLALLGYHIVARRAMRSGFDDRRAAHRAVPTVLSEPSVNAFLVERVAALKRAKLLSNGEQLQTDGAGVVATCAHPNARMFLRDGVAWQLLYRCLTRCLRRRGAAKVLPKIFV